MQIAVRKYTTNGICLLMLLIPRLSLALTLDNTSGIPTKSLDQVLGSITNWVLDFGILLCILMIIWGGINYVAAVGDDQRITSAKKTIHYAIWGLLIIAFSYTIIKAVDKILK